MVVKMNDILKQIADEICGAPGDMHNEGFSGDKNVKGAAGAGSVSISAAAGISRHVVPVFFIKFPEEFRVKEAGYVDLL